MLEFPDLPHGIESFGELLTLLRRELRPDAGTDLIEGSIAKALNLARGQATVTWNNGASRYTPSVTVNHGLGIVPQAVLLGQEPTANAAATPAPTANALTATTFTVFAYAVDAQPPVNDTAQIHWLALG